MNTPGNTVTYSEYMQSLIVLLKVTTDQAIEVVQSHTQKTQKSSKEANKEIKQTKCVLLHNT